MAPENPGRERAVPELTTTEQPPKSRADAFDDADLAVVILQALTTMAARSKRHQADLTAALKGADIAADPPRVRTALRLLCAQGAIENLVPLSDGGLLLSVTRKWSARRGPVTDWLALDQLETAAD